MPLDSSALLVGAAVLAEGTMLSFVAGIAMRFRAGRTRTRANHSMRTVGAAAWVLNSIQLHSMTRSGRSFGALESIGVVGCTLAMTLFFVTWSATRKADFGVALAPRPPDSLVRHGPFAWIRHPFYASYFLGWLSVAALLQTWTSGLLAVAMCLFYGTAAFQEERLIASSPVAADYAAYRTEVGMFVPRLRKWMRRAHPPRTTPRE